MPLRQGLAVQFSSVGRQEAAWAVALPVSPPASDARREFSTDEKGCAAEQPGSDKGDASAGTGVHTIARHKN